ncbi:ATP-binding protein [Puia sp.]|jgi:signal transduction histidine kinase|uniref:ATP-binding protein n=1 Tax=Puia sp. TaxID=2045100 RepID=UPI002F415103
MKGLRRIVVVPVLLICGLLSLSGFAQEPVAKKGIIDLRNADLFDNELKISGEWAFYWNRLLTPDSLSAAAPDYVPFPVLWKDLRLHGQPVPSQGYATYRLTVLLPAKRPRIGLEIHHVYSAYKLFANGVVVAQNGQPATTRENGTPFWVSRTVALAPGESDTLVLVMQVANFWHARGGPFKDILIGDKDELFLKKNQDAAYDFALTGCMLMGGLFFLGLYAFGRKDKTILYFSLFCIVFSYRMVGTNNYSLHSLFTHLDWFITVRIEYLTLSLGIALFSVYTRNLYPQDAHPVVMKLMVGFCLCFSAAVLLTPTIIFTRFLIFFLGIMFAFIAYAEYVYLRAARNHRSGSLFALLSTAIMLLIFLLTNLHYFGFIPDLRLVLFICYLSFFFLQSLALSHRFAHNFRQAADQAQQGLRAKSEFLSTMSHEIRTPLNAVIGMTHLLLRNDPRPDQESDLDVLMFSANNLLSIVNNILDYNKIEEGKISIEQIPLDLPAIARNIVAGLQTAAGEKGISLLLDVDDRLDGMLIGDPTRTSQVINNLVHNAIKFTKDGSVRVSLLVQEATGEAMTVTVSVEDTGIGISPEKQQMIFDRFTQADSSTSRSYGGTGLGLAISKRILELQGVELRVKSEPGKGSCFFYTQTFPLSDEVKIDGRTDRAIGGHELPLRDISLLLVEDNPLNVLVAQTMLENNGATVDVATNGVEAVERLDSSRHQLILMDLHMPVMDGYEATTLLRQRGETLPIIALTASMPKEVESEAFAAGLNGVIVKPFNPEELYRVILQQLRP